MADTLCVKDARFTLLSKDTFFQIKNDQKSFLPEFSQQIIRGYSTAIDAWTKAEPEHAFRGLFSGSAQYNKWQSEKPKAPFITLGMSARSLNIVYGMLRGHAYRDIEKKYRDSNGPDKYSISKILHYYGIDEEQFYSICGAIDYEN